MDPCLREDFLGADFKLDDLYLMSLSPLVALVKWLVLTHFTDEESEN